MSDVFRVQIGSIGWERQTLEERENLLVQGFEERTKSMPGSQRCSPTSLQARAIQLIEPSNCWNAAAAVSTKIACFGAIQNATKSRSLLFSIVQPSVQRISGNCAETYQLRRITTAATADAASFTLILFYTTLLSEEKKEWILWSRGTTKKRGKKNALLFRLSSLKEV